MIAISYRREDSLPTAGRLYDRLQAKFGKENVFMDFDSIPPGMDFREQIKQMIERSKLVIAIIGPHWLGEQPDASRRIDNPADFVRLEIAYALERGIPVIPVLVNNTPMPPAEKLPQEIEGLAFRNALTLDTGIDFHHHADRLITGIGKAIDLAPRSRGPRKVPEPAASAANRWPLRKIVTRSAAILLAAALLALAVRYVATHKPQPAKQVATTSTSTTPPLIVKPPVEQSSPPQLAVEQPKPVVEQSSQPQITNATRLDFASISKEHPYVNSLGMKFVPVPGIKVLFSIWDTRVRDFQTCVQATGYLLSGIDVMKVVKAENGGYTWKWELDKNASWEQPGFPQSPEHPVVGVSWDDAWTFCSWLTQKERKEGKIGSGQEYRLPTDDEWTAAVGETKYPWGDEWPAPKNAGNFLDERAAAKLGGPKDRWRHAPVDDGYAGTSPVGRFIPNRFALYDMGGNVLQWCQDWYRREMNPEMILTSYPELKNDRGGRACRVLRGSAWDNCDPERLLSSFHWCATTHFRGTDAGFRCVLGEIASTKDEKSSAALESLSPSAPNDTSGQKLTKVFVKKYGFSVLLPTEFFPDAALQLADANTDRLVSVNGCFRVAFNVSSGDVKKAYDNCIAEFRKEANNGTIDYKVLKETWFVVSGDSHTTGYYTKGVKRGEDIVVMQLEYTGDACNITDAMLTEMSHKFDGK